MGSIFLTKWWNKLDEETKDVIYLGNYIPECPTDSQKKLFDFRRN